MVGSLPPSRRGLFADSDPPAMGVTEERPLGRRTAVFRGALPALRAAQFRAARSCSMADRSSKRRVFRLGAPAGGMGFRLQQRAFDSVTR